MMAEKACLFGDNEAKAAILNTSDPKKHKEIGRSIKGFDKAKWEQHMLPFSKPFCWKEKFLLPFNKPFCWNIVYVGNYNKFNQNPDLKKRLMETVGTTLVEASPYDTIWGIGLSLENPDTLDRSKWMGLNWLGEVLTQLREDFYKNSLQ